MTFADLIRRGVPQPTPRDKQFVLGQPGTKIPRYSAPQNLIAREVPTSTSWLYSKGNASGSPIPPAPVLPLATLGTPVVVTGYAIDDQNRHLQQITIPVSFPTGIAPGDRVRVYLLAPDTTVDTQESFVGGPGVNETPGIIIGDATTASKFVTRQEAEYKGEFIWDSGNPSVTFNHPSPVIPQRWRAIVVTASKTVENAISSSPSVAFDVIPDPADVSGREYAPLGINFRLLDATGVPTNDPQYTRQDGGGWLYRYSLGWGNDTSDPRFPSLIGYDIEVEYGDGRRETTASKSKNDLHHDSDKWPVAPAPEKFTIWLVSFTDKGRNSIIPNLTPSVTFTVTVPVGLPGQEYAPNVTGFAYSVANYKTNANGQKVLMMTFVWTNPGDRSVYGGVVLHRSIAGGPPSAITGVVTGESVTVEFDSYPAATESWVFTAIAQSPANQPNTYVSGVTPEFALNISPPPTGTPPVLSLNATVVYSKDQFGINVYGYSVTWVDPNRLTNPDYQGAKIYWSYAADGSGLQPLSDVNSGQMWKSAMWPVVVDMTGRWIYAVSVDVNGKEATHGVSTPRVGPILITEQAGQIDNEAIPPIDITKFPPGMEPVETVSATPSSDGTLPGVAKKTQNVTNTVDWRLYQWNTSLAPPRYKIVGTAKDIAPQTIVNELYALDSITAPIVRASAISSIHMAGNTLLVGPTPSGPVADRPPVIQVNDNTAAPNTKIVAVIGEWLGWQGIYGVNLRIGPAFANSGDPKWIGLDASASNVTIKNITLQIEDNQASSHSVLFTSPAAFDPTYDSLALYCADKNGFGNNRAALVSRGFVMWEGVTPGSGTVLAALVKHPSYRAGELTLSRLDPNSISLAIMASAYGESGSSWPTEPFLSVRNATAGSGVWLRGNGMIQASSTVEGYTFNATSGVAGNAINTSAFVNANMGYRVGGGTTVIESTGRFIASAGVATSGTVTGSGFSSTGGMYAAGAMQADGGFRCQSYTGMNTAIRVMISATDARTMTFVGGLLISISSS